MNENWKCPNCNSLNPERRPECWHCGYSIVVVVPMVERDPQGINMYCASCGRQISSDSTFCKYCGSRNASSTRAVVEWEYQDFVWEWPSTQAWRLNAFYPEFQHRLERWQSKQDIIRAELQKWLDKGWQPIGEIGPASIKLHCFARTESDVTGTKVFGWIITLGLFFVFDLFTGSLWETYTYCRPTEFRLQMRHPKR